ncbi:MAG: hypothetical protein ACXVH5_04015 [Ilumatobacteraceae bacterium]
MRLAPTVVTAALLVVTSCTSDSTATATTTTTAVTVTTGSEAPKAITVSAVECVHTDPAKQPISVHRALTCPDGTSVAVKGITTRGADGSSMLCDAVPDTDCLKIDGADVVAAPSGGTVWYIGTVSKGVLTTDRTVPPKNP